MCRLSIIVPVFNSKQYLPCCIGSILNQSFTEFELLLIDDGSTDGSSDTCDSYATEDKRVRVLHKTNGGVSSARNLGLENAKGEWCWFIDSDDLLPARAFELLMACADCEVDMAYGTIRKFDGLEDSIETIVVDSEGKHSPEEALDAFVASKERPGDWHRYLFNRLFRMSIIQDFGLRFHTDVFYKEDGLFVVQYLCRCKQKIVCVSDVVYLYRQTNQSAMGSLAACYTTKLLTNVDAHGLILKELEHRGVDKSLLERERRHLFQNYYWIMGIMENTNSNTFRNRKLLKERMIKNVGFFSYLNSLIIPRYSSKIKKLLSI